MSSIINERLGSLSKDGIKEEKKRTAEKEQEAPELPPDLHDQELRQRLVIIQRDERGYGLTVSGDNPVFIQSVKKDGAACRAGVKQGDRIVKVNGTLVTNSNHVEVVKLIKSGSYVALTLLGRPSAAPVSGGSTPRSQSERSPPPVQSPLTSPAAITSPTEHIGGPLPAESDVSEEYRSQRAVTLQRMYQKVFTDFEVLKQKLATRTPDEALAKELEDKERMIKKLEQQLGNITGVPSQQTPIMSPNHHTPQQADSDGRRRHKSGQDDHHSDQSRFQVPAQPHSAPWLKGGPTHRKTGSLPESSFNLNDEVNVTPNITVSRSHSDSRRKRDKVQRAAEYTSEMRESAVEHQIEKFRGDMKLRRRRMMQKADSVPNSMYEHSVVSDQSGHASPILSPASRDGDDDQHPTADALVGYRGSPVPGDVSGMTVNSPQQVNIFNMEDDEFDSNTDDEQLEDHGPFADLSVLVQKPAHLAVFLHYLILNSDPSPLLFYIITDSYSQGSVKEMRKWAYEIHSTFLTKTSPLHINVDEGIVQQVEQTLTHRGDRMEALGGVFQFSRQAASTEINEQLQDFRVKRSLGLGNLYGDHELDPNNMDSSSEMRIIEKYIKPHFDNCLIDSSDRNRALTSALATFMKQSGVTLNKDHARLERCLSFNMRDKKMIKILKNRKTEEVSKHQFQSAQYHTVTYCNFCSLIIWGIGNQGFQCKDCEYNVHKACMRKVREACPEVKKKKSVLDKIISRKHSSNVPGAIKEAQQRLLMSEALVTSPNCGSTSPPPFVPQWSVRSDDDDDVAADVKGHDTTPTTASAEPERAPRFPSPARGGDDAPRPHSFPAANNLPAAKATFHLPAADTIPDVIPEGPEPHDAAQPNASAGGAQSPEIVTPEVDEQTKLTSLTRSESLNKRKTDRVKNVRRTRSDVLVDDKTMSHLLTQSGSSSNSSLSAKSVDSTVEETIPEQDAVHAQQVREEQVREAARAARATQAMEQYDSDLELPQALPALDSTIPKAELKKLKVKEKKRQEVINELFYTEQTHVRTLKIMHKVFYAPMLAQGEQLVRFETAKLLFPNLDEMITVHGSLNNAMKNRKKESPVVSEVADILLDRFDGDSGHLFRSSCAIWCQDQKRALEELRLLQTRDRKFAAFIQEAASSHLCRRLELKDFLPTGMKRLAMYPLLIENLMKYTSASSPELAKLQKALECARNTLEYVNEAVRDCENHQKLVDIQKRLDTRGFDHHELKNLDLTTHRMIYDGDLTWRINKQKSVDVHAVLLQDMLVLLQKQEEKLVLKSQSSMQLKDTRFTLSPIISLHELLTRNVATDKRGFFLVRASKVGPQLYDLVAMSAESKKKWFKYITEAADASNKAPATTRPVESKASVAATATDVISAAPKTPPPAYETLTENTPPPGEESTTTEPDENEILYSQEDETEEEPVTPQPEKNQSTFEALRQKDQLISTTLLEKERLVAELLHIPPGEFENIAEKVALGVLTADAQMLSSSEPEQQIAGELRQEEHEPKELVLAGIFQTNKLTELVNARLNPNQKDLVTNATVSEIAGSRNPASSNLDVSIPAHKLLAIATKLSHVQVHLMDLLTSQGEKMQKLQHQLDDTEEQLQTIRQLRGMPREASPPPARELTQGEGQTVPSAQADDAALSVSLEAAAANDPEPDAAVRSWQETSSPEVVPIPVEVLSTCSPIDLDPPNRTLEDEGGGQEPEAQNLQDSVLLEVSNSPVIDRFDLLSSSVTLDDAAAEGESSTDPEPRTRPTDNAVIVSARF